LQLGYDQLPESIPDDPSDETFLEKVHHALFNVSSHSPNVYLIRQLIDDVLCLFGCSILQIEVVKGNLVCPETGRKFPIVDGIPNMLLKEDEV
jgi:uncharacterized protein YbaR (Trm112 family)